MTFQLCPHTMYIRQVYMNYQHAVEDNNIGKAYQDNILDENLRPLSVVAGSNLGIYKRTATVYVVVLITAHLLD